MAANLHAVSISTLIRVGGDSHSREAVSVGRGGEAGMRVRRGQPWAVVGAILQDIAVDRRSRHPMKATMQLRETTLALKRVRGRIAIP